MELNAVETAAAHADRAIFGVAAGTENFKAPFRHAGHLVAMGHPNLNFAGKPLEKIAFSGDFQHGLAIFAGPAASDLSSEGMDHQLKSVADAENYLKSDLFTQDVVVELKPYFQSGSPAD